MFFYLQKLNWTLAHKKMFCMQDSINLTYDDSSTPQWLRQFFLLPIVFYAVFLAETVLIAVKCYLLLKVRFDGSVF